MKKTRDQITYFILLILLSIVVLWLIGKAYSYSCLVGQAIDPTNTEEFYINGLSIFLTGIVTIFIIVVVLINFWLAAKRIEKWKTKHENLTK